MGSAKLIPAFHNHIGVVSWRREPIKILTEQSEQVSPCPYSGKWYFAVDHFQLWFVQYGRSLGPIECFMTIVPGDIDMSNVGNLRQ